MFGIKNRQRLQNLIEAKARLEATYKFLSSEEKKLENALSEKALNLKRLKGKIEELQGEIDGLFGTIEYSIVRDAQVYLREDVERLLKVQETAHKEFFERIDANISSIDRWMGELSDKVGDLFEEMKEAGIDVARTITPLLIEKKSEEIVIDIIRAKLEFELFFRSQTLFEKELKEKGITLDSENKEKYLKQIGNKVWRVVELIISKIKNDDSKDTPKEIEPFDRDKELVHCKFDKLKGCVEAGVIPMLVGPAGTGKSTAVEQVARALGLPFYTMNRIQNAFELTGYNDAGGNYVSTQFYEAYTNGGVFFFDEIDASSPEALVTINTALAQGYMAFPNGVKRMHPDFKVVAAGNTFGKGADREYSGRNSLDSATLDRFMVIEWDYDKNLESKLVDDKQLLAFAWTIREIIDDNRMKIIISTRGIIATLKTIRSGVFTVDESLEGNLFENVKVDNLIKIIDQLEEKGMTLNNKYYKGLVTLKDRLTRSGKR